MVMVAALIVQYKMNTIAQSIIPKVYVNNVLIELMLTTHRMVVHLALMLIA
jgi:hypothetical protein